MKVLIWLSIGLDRRTPSEHILTGIVEALYQQGHSVHVLQKDTGGPLPVLYESLRELGVTTTAIPCKQSKRSNLLVRYLSDLIYVFKCRRHLKKHKNYDVVFLQSSNVAGFQVYELRRKLPSLPITFNVQDIFPENAVYSGALRKNGLLVRVLSKLQRYAYSHARSIITISEDMKGTLVSLGVQEDIVHVIYNWSYQDEPYNKSDLDTSAVAHLFKPQYFNVLYAGNIGRMQNVELVIKAASLMKKYTDVWFHIVGDGVYKKKLKRLAEDEGVENVSFWPFMNSELAPALYSSADVNIIPLSENVYKTALPSKVATCLSCAAPVVFCFGSESIFAKTVCSHSNHFLVSSTSPIDLVKAIIQVKESKDTIWIVKPVFYKTSFSRSNNSNQYTQLIVHGQSKDC